MARELLGNGQAITGLLGMLTSWEEPVRLAAVRALAKVCWQVRTMCRVLTSSACACPTKGLCRQFAVLGSIAMPYRDPDLHCCPVKQDVGLSDAP